MFLACLLFGKPIQQEVAKRAYLELLKAGLVTPERILEAGWDEIVRVLDAGHYVRYDFSTATKLLDVCRMLKEKNGTITTLIHQSGSRKELEKRLLEFKGVGPKTIIHLFSTASFSAAVKNSFISAPDISSISLAVGNNSWSQSSPSAFDLSALRTR